MAPTLVKRYLLAVSRYKWLFPVGLALGVTGASIAMAQPDPPPSYTMEAVLVSNRPPTVFSTTENEVRQSIDSVTVDSLIPESILNSVAKSAGIDPKQLLRSLKVDVPAAAGAKDKKAATPGEGNSNQIKLQYTDTDERRGKQIIQQLSEQIVAQSKEGNSARLKTIITSLNQRLPQAKTELRSAEQALEQYDRIEGPALVAAQNGSLSSAIAQGDNQQRLLSMQLVQINAEIGSLQQRLGLDPNQAYVSSALSADPIIANLRAQIYQVESQLAIASKDLTPEHPRVIDLTKQRDALNDQLRLRAQEVMGGGGVAAPFQAKIRQDSSLDPKRQEMANQLVALSTQRDGILQQLQLLARSRQDLRTQLQNLPNKQLGRTRLEDQFKLKKALYDQMQAKLIDAQTAEAETVSSFRIAQLSELPRAPKPPKNKPLMILVGGVIGLVLGGGIIFLLDMLEGVFFTAEEIREALRQQEVPVLGMLPLAPEEKFASSLPILHQIEPGYAEHYERFRSTLRLAEGKLPKLVLITSTIGQEGKSTVAYNLAIAAARAGKRTLLLELDLRSESHAAAVGVDVDPESRREPLDYYGQISDCIQLVPLVENLYMVPGVGVQSHAASILESSEMRRLLEDVRGRFDFVVLDAPALSQCNDALLLEAQTDGLILVTRPGVTQQSLLTEAIEQLNESEQLNFLGAVVNGLEVPPPKPAEIKQGYQPPKPPEMSSIPDALSTDSFPIEASSLDTASEEVSSMGSGSRDRL